MAAGLASVAFLLRFWAEKLESVNFRRYIADRLIYNATSASFGRCNFTSRDLNNDIYSVVDAHLLTRRVLV